MGVLDPLDASTSEAIDEVGDFYDITREYIEKVMNNRALVLHPDSDFEGQVFKEVFNIDISQINSEQELISKMSAINDIMDDLRTEIKANKTANLYFEKKDMDADYENPIQSWQELGELADKVEHVPQRIEDRLDQHDEKVTEDDVEFLRYFFDDLEYVEAFPIIEGVCRSIERIEQERESLMEHALSEHQRRSTEYEGVDILVEPIDWEQIITEEELSTVDYMDIDGINGASYGDVLHLMMEETLQEREDVNVEQPLHFLFPERPADRDPRPDVVDDLLVYDFKHMPLQQKAELQENGEIDQRHPKSIQNIHQMNSYLHNMELPAGILVYVSSDMQVEEYVVEKHRIADSDTYEDWFISQGFEDRFVHSKEDYDFEAIPKKL